MKLVKSLVPPGPATFHIQRHPVWRYWWDIAPSSTSPLLLAPWFPFLISLLWCRYRSYSHFQAVASPLGVGGWLTRLWAYWDALHPCDLLEGCTLETSLPGTAVFPGVNVPCTVLGQSTVCLTQCRACGCLLIIGKNEMRVEWFFPWHILCVGSSATWWGGGSILFESVMGLALNLSCLFFFYSPSKGFCC